MTDTIGLNALAMIQALEAGPRAQAFRDKWLDGMVIPRSEVQAWLEEHPVDSPAGVELCELAESLNEDFGPGWRSGAAHFILADVTPELMSVSAKVERYFRSPEHLRGAPVLSPPVRSEIVLRCRPETTDRDLLAAYEAAQTEALAELSIAPRERARPVTSLRTRDLAVFGARVVLEEFACWGEALSAYLREYPEEAATTFSGEQTETENEGRFRRDLRRSYKQVTGFDLDWKPKRGGGAPTLTAQPPDRVFGWYRWRVVGGELETLGTIILENGTEWPWPFKSGWTKGGK